MATLLFFYPLKFKMPAYWLLPLWLVAELFYGSAHGQFSPVAHWAHVGGFLFGMLGANVLRRSGLEQQANEAIESELGWMSNPDIVGASDTMDQGRLAGVYCECGRQISKSSFFVYFKASGWYYPRWVVCSSSSFSTLAKACCAKVCFEST